MNSNSFRIPQKMIACTFLVGFLCAMPLSAEDWPQWRGANRDGVWRETGVLDAIPPSGLKVRWRVRIGRGYSGPVVAQGRVFVTDHQFNPEVERVLCFDEATGKPVWSHTYPVDYENMEYGNGPRASPTVHEGKVYTLGTQGHLFCLDARTGNVVWKKDLAREYDARIPQYGASVAPLVEGNLLIVCIGGQPAASVIAFDRNSGEQRWKVLDDRPAYSAPIAVNRGGCQQAIVWTADTITSLNPTTGAVYWQEPWKTTFDEAQVVATPVLHNSRLLCVMAWNRGSMMLELDAEKPAATVLWKTRTQPSTTMSTPVWIDDDHFCAIDRVGGLSCLDANSGDEVWRTTEVTGVGAMGHAHLTPNGDRFFLFNQRGHLICAQITPTGYEELGRTLLVEPTAGHRAQGPVAWAHPAYANKHVIARNDRELVSASLDAGQYPALDRSVVKSEAESRDLSQFVGRDAALALVFSPDGQTLALGTWKGDIKLLDVSSGEVKQPSPPGLMNNCSSVVFSPNGMLFAYVGGSEFGQARNNYKASGKVRLWDLTTSTLRGNLEGHESKVMSAVFSPNGKTLATGSADQTIRIWDTASNEQLSVLRGHTDAVSALAFSPDGKTLVSASWDKSVKFWSVNTGAEVASINAHEEEILSVAISPDGTTLASGSADWTVRLWGMAERKERVILKGHKGAVYCMAFSSDSKTLATGSGDETVKLWDVPTGQVQTTLLEHQSGISALAFSPDSRSLASAGRDDAVRLWELDLSK